MGPASKSKSAIIGDKGTFKISIVDDEPNSMGYEMSEIKHYLSKRGIALKTTKYKNAEEAAKIDPTTDIAFIDKNLNGDDGVDVVGSIRERHMLLDILIYSRRGIPDQDLKRLSSYGMVEVVQNKEQVIDRLRKLVEKNLSKWSDIVYMRGTVISRLIDIEQEINAALMGVFSPHDEEKFRRLILENSDISVQAKQRILRKIAKSMDRKPFNVTDLQKLQEHRNMLAHCRRSPDDPNILIKDGADKQIGKDEIKTIFEKANSFSECLKSFTQSLR